MDKQLKIKALPLLNHLKHPETGYFLCDSKNPMPSNAPAGTQWFHQNVQLIETPEACLLRILERNLLYRCPNCNTEWIIHEDSIIEGTK